LLRCKAPCHYAESDLTKRAPANGRPCWGQIEGRNTRKRREPRPSYLIVRSLQCCDGFPIVDTGERSERCWGFFLGDNTLARIGSPVLISGCFGTVRTSLPKRLTIRSKPTSALSSKSNYGLGATCELTGCCTPATHRARPRNLRATGEPSGRRVLYDPPTHPRFGKMVGGVNARQNDQLTLHRP